MGLCLLVALIATASAASDWCASAPDCVTCQDRITSTGPCQWYVATPLGASSPRSVGCQAPGVSNFGTAVIQCPPSVSWCTSATTCVDCLSRTGPDSMRCSWVKDGGLNAGCVASSTWVTGTRQYTCDSVTHSSYSAMVSIVSVCAGGASMLIGLAVGAIIYARAIGASPADKQSAAALLYVLSWVFCRASFFSAALSFQVSRARSRGCSCNLGGIITLGSLELIGVVSGFLTGIIIDSYYVEQPFYFVSMVSFTLIIGMPTVLGSLLCFGLPRLLMSNCSAKAPQAHRDDDITSESRPLVSPHEAASSVPYQQGGNAYVRPSVAYSVQSSYPPQLDGMGSPPMYSAHGQPHAKQGM